MGLTLRGSSIRAVDGLKARDEGSEAQEFLECSVSFSFASDLGKPSIVLIPCGSVKGAKGVLWAESVDSDTQRFSLCPLVSHKALDSDRISWGPITRGSSRGAEGRMEDETGSTETKRFSLLCVTFHGVSDPVGTHAGLVS